MRTGQYIRALGRQSFEPSQLTPEDIAASEESQRRQNAMSKAQNEILATVGMALRDNKQKGDKSPSVGAENEFGLILGAVDLAVTYVATWPLVGLRNRLQTFRGAEHACYYDVVKLAWRQNTWAQLFSGLPAHLLYQIVNLGRDYAQSRLISKLSRTSLFRDGQSGQKKNLWWLLVIDKSISLGAWALIYPLIRHCTLQSLHLLPAQPLFPTLASFIPLSSASPLSIPTSLLSISTFTNSYFLLSFITQSSSFKLQLYLFRKVLSYLPRPSTDKEDFYELDSNWSGGSSDNEYPGTSIMIEADSRHGQAPTLTATFRVEDEPRHTRDLSDADLLEVEGAAERSNTTTIGPPPLAQATIPASLPPPPPPPQPAATPSTERSAQRKPDRTEQLRATTLSSHPADVAASHAADGIASALTLWNDNVAFRLLARGFLSEQGVAKGAVNALVLRPSDLWSGTGLVVQALVGGEWLLMWGLFEISYGVSTLAGVRFFGYRRKI